jgi:hypothetical protein
VMNALNDLASKLLNATDLVVVVTLLLVTRGT